MTNENKTPDEIILDEANLDEIKVEEAKPVEVVLDQSLKNISIGQLIKNKREEKNLTIKVISQQTKIHIGLLEHLENDELEKLPSKTYVRGFVKSTAKILGINQNEALAVLENSYLQKGPQKETKIYHAPPPENSLGNNYTPNSPFSMENIKSVAISYGSSILKIGAVAVLVVVLGINLKNYVKNSNGDSKLKLPVVLTTIHQKTKPAPKPVQPKVEPKTVAEPTPIQVNLIRENKKDVVEKTEITVKDVKLKPVSNTEKQFSTTTTLTKEQFDEYLPARFRFNVAKGVESVFINAVDGDSWITYKVDDKEIKKYVLRQGRTVFMRGANIRLFVGNTKNVKVFYNNQFIDLGTKTVMKNLVFPEDLKAKFMNPLFVFQKDGTVLTSDEYVKLNHTEPKPTETIPATKAKQ